MELIVAIVILSIGLLGLAATSGSVMRLIGGGGHQTVAANVALARFERQRGLVTVAMTQVHDTIGHPRHRTIRPHAVQSHRNDGNGPVGGAA